MIVRKKIAIQGGLGSFHHEAVNDLLNDEIEIIEKDHFRGVANAVAIEETDLGLIAIENSIAGSILANYNLITQHDLKIVKEKYLPIRHQFMALPGVKIDDVQAVYSHNMALLQCEDFLDQYHDMQRVEYVDTAKSAEMIKRENLKNAAAIASNTAAKLYDMEILYHDIQTFDDNFTRFVLLSKQLNEDDSFNKVSLSFELPHESGSLSNVLLQFSINKLNLANIQSYPISNRPFSYRFYVDVLVNDYKSLENTLKVIDLMTEKLIILGKYTNKQINLL